MVSTASKNAKALQASLNSKNKHEKRVAAFMEANSSCCIHKPRPAGGHTSKPLYNKKLNFQLEIYIDNNIKNECRQVHTFYQWEKTLNESMDRRLERALSNKSFKFLFFYLFH